MTSINEGERIASLSRRFLSAKGASYQAWRCGRFLFEQQHPLIMSVINVTPDSFSDGGLYKNAQSAIAYGVRMGEEGADILDIGGVSTRPGALPVSTEEEKRRILPVVKGLVAAGFAVSVDTTNPTIMRVVLDAGAVIINDVYAYQAEGAAAAIADSDCGIVIMHMKGKPQTMQDSPQYNNVFEEVTTFLHGRAEHLKTMGVAKERICLDPGIGFGKMIKHNWTLLNRFSELSECYPLLAGVSRKSLFAEICKGAKPTQRDVASAAAAALLMWQGVRVLRVHNVQLTQEALGVALAMAHA